jgi:hypothetical protein
MRERVLSEEVWETVGLPVGPSELFDPGADGG